MKKTITKDIIITILVFPFIVLFLLWVLLYTPFDYLKYKRSRYYKDTKEKYSWMCAFSYIKFYDLIKKENLPIDFYRCDDTPITGYGFFVYKDTLIINDYQEPYYDEEKNIWMVEIEDEYIDMKDDVANVIEKCNELLKTDVCKKAVVLIDRDLYEEHPDVEYENIDFLPVRHDLDIEAIKALFI